MYHFYTPLNETLENYNLEPVVQQSQDLLQEFATRRDFTDQMQLTFGEEVDVASLQETWASGNLGTLPEIEVLPASEINGANGAFARENNTIYLSQELLNQGNTDTITTVFLEEYGHYLDSTLSSMEAKGDEGALFSKLAQGESVSDLATTALKSESDHSVVEIDNEPITIEQFTFQIGGGVSGELVKSVAPFNSFLVWGSDTDSQIELLPDWLYSFPRKGTLPNGIEGTSQGINVPSVDFEAGFGFDFHNQREDLLKEGVQAGVEGGVGTPDLGIGINAYGNGTSSAPDDGAELVGNIGGSSLIAIDAGISYDLTFTKKVASEEELAKIIPSFLPFNPTQDPIGIPTGAENVVPISLNISEESIRFIQNQITPNARLSATSPTLSAKNSTDQIQTQAQEVDTSVLDTFQALRDSIGGNNFNSVINDLESFDASSLVDAFDKLGDQLFDVIDTILSNPLPLSSSDEFASASLSSQKNSPETLQLLPGFPDVPSDIINFLSGLSEDILNTIKGLGSDGLETLIQLSEEVNGQLNQSLGVISEFADQFPNSFNEAIEDLQSLANEVGDEVSLKPALDAIKETTEFGEFIASQNANSLKQILTDPNQVPDQIKEVTENVISNLESLLIPKVDSSFFKEAFAEIPSPTNESPKLNNLFEEIPELPSDLEQILPAKLSTPSELSEGDIELPSFIENPLSKINVDELASALSSALPEEQFKQLFSENSGEQILNILESPESALNNLNISEENFPDELPFGELPDPLPSAEEIKSLILGADNGGGNDNGNDQPPEQVNTISLINNQNDNVEGTNEEKDIFQLNLTGFANTGNFNFGKDQIANYNPDDEDVIRFINAPENLNEIDELTNSFTGAFTNVTAVNSASPAGTALTFEPSGFDNSAEVVLTGEQFEFDAQPSLDQLINEVGVQFEFKSNGSSNRGDNNDGQPQTFEVVNTNDSGPGSLRNAIEQANANEGEDTITFDESILEAPFPGIPATASIDLSSGQLEITDDLTIEGLGAGALTIDALGNSRVFSVNNGNENLIDVTLSGLEIVNGETEGNGGGVLNAENLTLINTSVAFNSATATQSPGGGIANINGTLTLVNSTVLENESANSGGGILSSSERDNALNVLNSTISNNDAAFGGAGIQINEGEAQIVQSTIADNSSNDDAGAGGIKNSGNLRLGNSIVDDNQPSDIDNNGSISTFGNDVINLVGDGSLSGENVINKDALLQDFPENNGGPTDTYSLDRDSPAIDTNSEIPGDEFDLDGDGETSDPLPFDQRGEGFDRVVDNQIDLGALELQEAVNNPPQVNNAISNQNATEDESFQFQVPENTFSDPDDETLNLSASLADGSELPDWLSFNADNRTFNGTPDEEDYGTLNLQVTAEDSEGATANDSFTLNVEEQDTVTNLNWSLAGTGNFDGSGQQDDLLWRNTSTGENVVWEMDGTIRQNIAQLETLENLNWNLVGTGNFDGSGQQDDLLWRNTSTGENIVWEMDGTTRQNIAQLETVADLNWSLIGASDFNQDHQDDLLWHNSSNGRNLIWEMNGTNRVGSSELDSVTDLNQSAIA